MFYSAWPTHCLPSNYGLPPDGDHIIVYHHEYTSMWQIVLAANLSQRGPEAQRHW